MTTLKQKLEERTERKIDKLRKRNYSKDKFGEKSKNKGEMVKMEGRGGK